MKIYYFSSILILGFIISYVQGQSTDTTDQITEVTSPDPTVDIFSDATTDISSDATIVINPTTQRPTAAPTTRPTTTTTTTSTTTTTTPVYTTPTPPPNATWAVIGGLAGGLAAIGLLGCAVGVYMCHRSSQRRVHIAKTRTDPNNIQLEDLSF